MSQQDEIQNLIIIHQRRLHILKQQRATLGIRTSPDIQMEIEDIEVKVAELQVKLQKPEYSTPIESPRTPSQKEEKMDLPHSPPGKVDNANQNSQPTEIPTPREALSAIQNVATSTVKQPNEMTTSTQSPASYALVMKGGGVKGLAYVGALEQLLKHQYKFNWYVGTSAGAIAAVLLAAGYEVDELKQILCEKNFRDFLDAKWYEWPGNFLFHQGIHHANTFTDWIDQLLVKKLKLPPHIKLKDLPNRVTVYASRKDQDALVFDSHDPETRNTPAAHAVRCSMSIPFIFIPQMRDGMRIFDGGLRNNYPIDILLREQPGQDFVGLYLTSETFEGRSKLAPLLSDILSIWTEALDENAIRKYWAKTVIINPKPIEMVDFGLDDEEKKFLLGLGRVAAYNFLLNQQKLTDKNKVEAETEEIEQIRSRLSQKRLQRRRKRTAVIGIALALIIISIITFIRSMAKDTGSATLTPIASGEITIDPTATVTLLLMEEPTPIPGISTEDITATPPPTSTPTATDEPTPAPTIATTPPTYSGNLAIPLIAGLDSKVYLTSLDGQGINGPNPIFREAQQPMFSWDGHSILVKATIGGKSGIHKLTASGFNPELSVERKSAEWPVFSPDGEMMMFSESTLGFPLLLRKADGIIEEIYFNDSSLSVKNLLWSEDNQLTFQGCATWLNQPDSCGIWITNVHNLNPKLLIADKDAYPMSVRADLLAYMSQAEGDWEVYIVSLTEGLATKLTDNEIEDGLPVISPQENGIAYISKQNGTWGLWTMGIDGQNKKRMFDIDPGSGTIDIQQWHNERMSWRQ